LPLLEGEDIFLKSSSHRDEILSLVSSSSSGILLEGEDALSKSSLSLFLGGGDIGGTSRRIFSSNPPPPFGRGRM